MQQSFAFEIWRQKRRDMKKDGNFGEEREK
jgi:hypothetical protein